MRTLTIMDAMKTPAHWSATGTVSALESAALRDSKPAEPEMLRMRPTCRAIGILKTLDACARPFGAMLALLVCLAWPGIAWGEPDYTNENAVAGFVKQMLYWPDATTTNKNSAAFRYKHLLYVNKDGIRPDLTNMPSLYADAERAKSQIAEMELLRGLTNNPASSVLRNLLLDIYYDRTVAESIFARQALEKAERAHFGPGIGDYVPPGGFVIDNEIAAYTAALQSNRVALATYCALLTNHLGVADDVTGSPLGYRIFQEQVPARGLDPACYLSNGVIASVTADTNALFAGYKDLVLLYELLSDHGRTASTLARLRLLRNSDTGGTEALVTEAERHLFLHSQTLRTAFPALTGNEGALTHSGLATALASVSDSLAALEGVKQLQRSRLNPLGFEPDFLVLVQGGFAGEVARWDSYDAFLVHLGDSASALGQASDAFALAQSSYVAVRESETELASQFDNSSITYADRLRDITGVFPDDPAYSLYRDGAPGSDLNLQSLSISNALLSITNISVQMDNVHAKIAIELGRSNSVTTAYISYGTSRAKLVDEISKIKAVQAAANAIASGVSDSVGSFGVSVAAQAINAGVQAASEIAIGNKEEALENLAAAQDAKIEGIGSAAQVRTWLLELNTLQVDLLSAQVKLQQELNLFLSLYREKADLEQKIKEKNSSLAGRYFADPIHRLSLQANMVDADIKFQEAQKWLFFMARALEYKWNEPFKKNNGWALESLFKLRNASELKAMYLEMKAFDDASSLYTTLDDRWDWLSLREDLLGYRQFGNQGETLTYVDPVTGESVDAITLFRRHLLRQQDAEGVVNLEFDTVRQNHNTFFRGPSKELGTPGQYLDKIDCMVIRLPGQHTTTNYTQWDTLSGALGYGGSSYIRNKDAGTPAAGRPDRLVNEMTAYSTKWWYETPEGWRFREVRTNTVSMLKANPAAARQEHDFPGDIPDRLATHALIINTFRERSVAASRWILRIPTRHPSIPGVQTLRIEELNDVEIYFYHWSYERK